MARPTKREQTNKKISEAMKISEEEQERIIERMEEAAKWDWTLEEICEYAGVSYSTYHIWTKKNPELNKRIEMLRDDPVRKAKKTVAEKIPESYQNAMDYLKRKRKTEFSERQELTGADGKELKIEISQEIANKNALTSSPENNSERPS
ncbi:MAG: hypothetical protein L6Q29_03585 [Candidatus Pacebacteria bacterium]|nr:hypothetical protein [Candidatus Paceibacterota bacterium]NUQ57489.1 hypothetical protein [Candidatus Paceibacter sp.]